MLRFLALILIGTLTFGNRTAGAELSAVDIYRQTLRGTAWVITPTKGKGTGWVVDRNRKLLITNFHVVADHESVDVVFPVHRDGQLVTERSYYTGNLRELQRTGRAVSGKVRRTDAARDLALIELDALPDDVIELKLAATKPLPGDGVHSIGNRRDLDELWGYTSGHVRQTFRTAEGYFWQGRQLAKGAGMVLVDSPILEGDSGGSLVNGRSEIVGVVSAVRWQARLASLCIDAEEVRAFVKMPPVAEKEPQPTGAAEVYRKALRSVATVKTSTSNGRGTAWVLDRNRKLLLTSATAVDAPDFVDVVFPFRKDGRPIAEANYYRDHRHELRDSGHIRRARVLARDAGRNLALLEVDALPDGTEELTLGDSVPDPGERLHILGNPNSVESLWVYAGGNVRQLGRTKLDPAADAKEVRVIVAQLPLSDGDSGGPVLDDRGRLVGVVSGKDAPQQLVGYLLDVTEVKKFLEATRPVREPRSAEELLRRAALYARLRLWARAVADCDAGIKIEPKNAAALTERARARLMKGDTDGALLDCEAALKVDPKCAAAYLGRAAVRSRQGDQDRAIADCDAALKIEPKNAVAFSTRGDVRRRKDDLTGALTDLDEAIWLDPNLAPAYFQRGLVHVAKRAPAKAADDLGRAAILDPNWAEAARRWGDVLREVGEEEKAVRAYDRAIVADPDDADAWLRRGMARAARGQHERAADDFGEAVRLRIDLADTALAEIERHGADLARGDPPNWEACSAWYRRSLTALLPGLERIPEAVRMLRAGLDAAAREPNERRRAELLRAVIVELRGKLSRPR
jgi:tetratricopeptide (TPR) repeat protein/S1-C subfamily serine protease